MSIPRLEDLLADFPEAQVTDSLGEASVRVTGGDWVAVATAARDSGFDMFTDLCAVDYLSREPRFEVVLTITSFDPPRRLRLVTGVAGDDPVVPSLADVFPGADFYEREAFDLFGIRFEGHPDLTRILLPDEWEGHPLRKDKGVGSVPVQFKGAKQAT